MTLAEYELRAAALDARFGASLLDLPYDINGKLVKTGDRVRSTPGLDRLNIREGVAKLCAEPWYPNCISVDGWVSAASLWEIVEVS